MFRAARATTPASLRPGCDSVEEDEVRAKVKRLDDLIRDFQKERRALHKLLPPPPFKGSNRKVSTRRAMDQADARRAGWGYEG